MSTTLNPNLSSSLSDGSSSHPLADNLKPLSKEREQLVSYVLDLYQCKPTKEKFNFYSENALFEDPISYAVGLANVKAQFYAMPKVFAKSTADSYKIVKNEEKSIEIDLRVIYTLALFKKDIAVNSLAVLDLNDEGKIVRHADLWDGKPLRKEGIFGTISMFLRKTNATVVSTFMQIRE
ncbi:hypothetical protein G9A89_013437 [Geosiphon pyriformis]|nr:hypothetical protein G9A89_013437 [Geosiphon pyriformis]